VANSSDPAKPDPINAHSLHAGKRGSPASRNGDRTSPEYVLASQTCRHLFLGEPVIPVDCEQALAKELRLAPCMRSHRVSNFPDPTNVGVVRPLGVDRNAPRHERAHAACDALVLGAGS
jgi:hypothetical protein